tara:strand:- start:70 stop:513 length:444 start_codon:yes stop_codon:yes gene_type:complete
MTDDLEGTTQQKGIVTCAADYSEELGSLGEYFKEPKIANAARFALAIGIQKSLRVYKKDWKKQTKKKKVRTIAHLGQFGMGIYDFEVLVEMLDLKEETDLENNTPVNTILSEYVTGGMKWITEQDIHLGGNFSALKNDKQFSTLFPD